MVNVKPAPPAALAALLVFVPVCAMAAQSRDQNIAEIVQWVQVQSLIQQSQTEALQLAHTRMNQMRAQLGEYLAVMSPDHNQKFEAAIDRYITTVATGFDPAEAAAKWGNAFASHFTDGELDDVVASSRTALGGKILKASVAASSQWNAEIRKIRSQMNEAAYNQLMAEVKPIFDEISRREAPSDRPPKK